MYVSTITVKPSGNFQFLHFRSRNGRWAFHGWGNHQPSHFFSFHTLLRMHDDREIFKWTKGDDLLIFERNIRHFGMRASQLLLSVNADKNPFLEAQVAILCLLMQRAMQLRARLLDKRVTRTWSQDIEPSSFGSQWEPKCQTGLSRKQLRSVGNLPKLRSVSRFDGKYFKALITG